MSGRVRVRDKRSGTDGRLFKGPMILLGVFACTAVLVFWLQLKGTPYLSVINNQSDSLKPSVSVSEGPANARGELRPYCGRTMDYFEEKALENSIAQARLFHTQGGNLKSVQNLLDGNIDATLKKLGATFIPKGMTEEQGTQDVTQYLKSYYAQNYDPRGGYGRPLPGEYKPKTHPLIHGGRLLEVADPTDTIERWDYSLGPKDLDCPNLLRIGETVNGDTKWYCQPMKTKKNETSKQIRRLSAMDKDSSRKNDCHIISIGGNDNWKFELEVVTIMPGCITHTFDCTLQNGTPKRKPDRDDIRFYNYCIDGVERKDEHGRHFITYFDIVQKAQLQAPPMMFKIDVEGFEFDVFSSMIQQANSNDEIAIISKPSDGANSTAHHTPSYWLPQQIMVELHWATRMTGISWMPRTRTTAEIALLSGMMYTGGGYMPIFRNWIKYCPSCMEVLFFRMLC